jgi:hypothetical protein
VEWENLFPRENLFRPTKQEKEICSAQWSIRENRGIPRRGQRDLAKEQFWRRMLRQ